LIHGVGDRRIRNCMNEGIPAVFVVIKAVSRSGYDGDSYHAGLV